MPAEAAQLEMADLNDWFGNFNSEGIGHEEGPADVLAEEFQPAEDVDVAPNGGEVEAVTRANIAVGCIAVVQSDIDGNMLLDLLRCGLERGQCRLCRSQGRPACRCWIVARDRKYRDDRIADILQNVAPARYDARHDQIKEGIQELNDPLLGESAETAQVGEQHCRLEVADVASLNGASHDSRTRIAPNIGGEKLAVDPPDNRRFENGYECRDEFAKQFDIASVKPPGASVAKDIAFTIRFEKTRGAIT